MASSSRLLVKEEASHRGFLSLPFLLAECHMPVRPVPMVTAADDHRVESVAAPVTAFSSSLSSCTPPIQAQIENLIKK